MRLTPYEENARREVETWQDGQKTLLQTALNWTMMPIDWAIKQVVPEEVIDQASDAIAGFLNILNDASEWTWDEKDLINDAKAAGLEIESIEDLRNEELEVLDTLAKEYFTSNAVLAAVQGGGTGLGGALFIAADIPLLFAINLRVIQQIGASFGFKVDNDEYKPLILSIFNVAASGKQKAKTEALREISVAAAAFAHEMDYKGRRNTDTWADQNRHLPREIAKNLIGHKLGQMIPVAGAVVAAGVNYWFTTETAEAAYMLFRSMYIQRKERL